MVDVYRPDRVWFYYYFQTATFNSDKMTVETTGKKLVIDDHTGVLTTTDLNDSILRFWKVRKI